MKRPRRAPEPSASFYDTRCAPCAEPSRRRQPVAPPGALKAARLATPRSDAGATSYVPGRPRPLGDGRVAVHLQQHHLGLPVYDARRIAIGSDRGFRCPGRAVRIPGTTRCDPTVTALRAAARAASFLVPGRPEPEALRLRHQFPPPGRHTVIESAERPEPVTAHLTLLPWRKRVRLAWVVQVTDGAGEEFEVLVDAHSEDVLLSRRLTACAVYGFVLPGLPDLDPVAERVAFPGPEHAYLQPPGLPPAADSLRGFPWPWAEADSQQRYRLKGNNVECWLGNVESDIHAAAAGGDAIFQADDGHGQWALNAFHACNLMHDFFYLLGFDEGSDNYQSKNRGTAAGTREGDSIRVEVHDAELRTSDGTVLGARFQPVRNRLQFGRWGNEHTALDLGVAAHEYAHAVTARLVDGGGTNRLAGGPAARAMNEGYSDYFAVTFVDYYRRGRRAPPGRSFGFPGMRLWPYAGEPPVPALTRPPSDPEYGMRALQAWCAALLEMHERIAAIEGDAGRGEVVAWRMVLGSIRLLRPRRAGNGAAPLTFEAGVAALEEALATAREGGVYGARLQEKRRSVRSCFERFQLV